MRSLRCHFLDSICSKFHDTQEPVNANERSDFRIANETRDMWVPGVNVLALLMLMKEAIPALQMRCEIYRVPKAPSVSVCMLAYVGHPHVFGDFDSAESEHRLDTRQVRRMNLP